MGVHSGVPCTSCTSCLCYLAEGSRLRPQCTVSFAECGVLKACCSPRPLCEQVSRKGGRVLMVVQAQVQAGASGSLHIQARSYLDG